MDSFRERIKNEFLEKLNPQQQVAVQHRDGPLLIFAGAGSGKTRVITYRIAYLIRIYDVNPESIVAVTFTNKAAEEMKERVLQLIGPYGERVTIKTFHSLGLQILRENYDKLSLKSNFTVYDQSSQKSVAKKVLKALHQDDGEFTANDYIQKINQAKDDFLNPDQFYDRYSELQNIDNLYNFYVKYNEEVRNSNAVDFGDLLFESVRLFYEYPEVLERYHRRWHYFLIDEYQDTNYVQYLMAMLLSRKSKNLAVVGDDDQCIYSWRGAKRDNILNFKNDFPDAKIIKLEENYRSSNRILHLANKLISHNKHRVEKKLFSRIEGCCDPVFMEASNDQEEVFRITREILFLMKYYELHEIAIFYRTNSQSRVIEQSLREHQLPYVIYGGIRFFERKEIKDILSYLQFLYNPYDYDSFQRMVENPPKGIGEKTLSRIQEHARRHGRNYLEAMKDAIDSKEIKNKKLEEFYYKLLDWNVLLHSETGTFTDLVKTIVDNSGIIDYYGKDNSPENNARIENIREYLQSVSEYEQKKGKLKKTVLLQEYLQEIALINDDFLSGSGKKEAIQLMTLHNAKGLEFDVVFIMGLEEGLLPHQLSQNSEEEIEEERRLLYVGITRARERLYLSYAKTRNRFGNSEQRTPSRFLVEMGFLKEEKKKEEPVAGTFLQPARKSEERYVINEKYIHAKYGPGILKKVEKVSGKTILTIQFFNGETKRFLAEHAPIRKA